MSTFDWAEFFESVSLVDDALRAGSDFGAMDFATRDRYRHAIEDLARGSRRSELDVAGRRSRERTERGRSDGAALPAESRAEDPGYYLISKGRRRFEREIGYRVPSAQRLLRAYVARRHAGLPRHHRRPDARSARARSSRRRACGGREPGRARSARARSRLSRRPISPSRSSIASSRSCSARDALPRLELRDGVPPDLRTLVVVPTLLTNDAEIEEQVNRLEVHYLANPDGDLRFALLSDWTDAPTETMPDDDAAPRGRREGIARLNRRHGPVPGGGDRFLLLHRRRLWNAGESAVDGMGAQARQAPRAEPAAPRRDRHDLHRPSPAGTLPVRRSATSITLDADTRLPRAPRRRLVGTMAHPLNRPVFDAARGPRRRGLRRPSAARHAHAARPTATARSSSGIFAGPAGVDPYAAAVSDVYQDLFGEGSYTGQGHLRRRRVRGGARGPRAREHAPEPRSLRGDLRAGRPRHRHRAVRGVPVALRGRGRPPASLGARRLAAAALDPPRRRCEPEPVRAHPGDRSLEDGRQSPPHALGAGRVAHAGRRLDACPAASPLVWTTFVLATIALPALLPAFCRGDPAAPGISKRIHLRARRRGAVALGGLAGRAVRSRSWRIRPG